MPGENNPWSGELKARRKKSRTADLSSKEGTTVANPKSSKSESKDNIKSLETPTPYDSKQTSNIPDTNKTDTKYLDTASTDINTMYSIGRDTNLNRKETPVDSVTNTNTRTTKDQTHNLLNKKLKMPYKDEGSKQENHLQIEDINNLLTFNDEGVVKDQQPRTEDEDSKILKITRRNLKPVLQPFKRSETNTDDVQTETPVDRLIRQGSLEGTSEQPNARLSNNSQTRTMTDLSSPKGKPAIKKKKVE